MGSKIRKILSEKLKISDEEKKLLTRGYQKIGDIIIINLRNELWKYEGEIGEIFLHSIPNTRTVCRMTDKIKGQYRQPTIKVIAGDKDTITIHKENGILYKLDVSKIMFSKGNLFERKRLIEKVKEGETIVDMFAGIGYFSLGLAKFTKAKRIYSIEINPESYHYLWENIKINKLQDKIFPIFGDCKEESKELGKIADRVIMGLLPSPKNYLESAVFLVKKHGIIHYHSTLGEGEDPQRILSEINELVSKRDLKVKLLNFKKVKSYAPKVNHVVLDLEVL
ncbi:MAG: class I SAM-dependent methyltransferase family protein [Candidatus Aenigmatarchaeota archaeon]